MRDILRYCESQKEWLAETISALVTLESPTDDKAAVDRCGRALEASLASSGGAVTRVPQQIAGDHLRVEFGGGDPTVLMLGHFDTVWPVGQLRSMPLRVDEGRLHGPGVFDMKAGIAIGILAVRALQNADGGLRPRVVMLWTTDEETGSRTSRALVEAAARESAAVLVLEPSLPGGALKTSRKGCGEFTISIEGVAAHAGVDPTRGASAIVELARQILAVQAFQDLDRGITVNVGVAAGGRRANIVPDEAHMVVDVRVPTRQDADRIDSSFRELVAGTPGTRLRVAGGVERPPLERGPGVARLFDLARDVASELGQELREGGTGGGSDGNFTAALGVPTLDGLGAIGDGAHALHEHVVLDQLPGRAALVAGLIRRLGRASTGW
jgi:glutamate carboxypeptidase